MKLLPVILNFFSKDKDKNMRVVDFCFMLTYSEAIFAQIKTQYKSQIRAALDECWSFLENKNKSGKDLYILLDDGTDFNGIFIYM